MLNIACINSYIIITHNLLRNNAKPITIKEFMTQLQEEMLKPWLERRVNLPTLQRSLKQTICDILNLNTVEEELYCAESKRSICHICPSRKRLMTTTF